MLYCVLNIVDLYFESRLETYSEILPELVVSHADAASRCASVENSVSC